MRAHFSLRKLAKWHMVHSRESLTEAGRVGSRT
jgi:hypothetical protein